MSCPDSVVAGPELVLIRNTKNVLTMRVFKGRSPFRLESNDSFIKLVISRGQGVDAQIVLALDSESPSIDIHEEDDGTFTVTFVPYNFEDLPDNLYQYAMFVGEYIDDDEVATLRALTLPANLRIIESIGPDEYPLPELLIGP